MLTDIQLKEIAALLKEADIDVTFDEKTFSKNVVAIEAQGEKIIFDELIARVKILIKLCKIDFDCEPQRDAYRLLRHIHAIETVNFLADNEKFLAAQTKKLDSFDRVTFCLNATLAGALKLAESLFDEGCNPQKNTYIISYAICSGNNEWVKKLVSNWNIDIISEKYCFYFYAKKLNNTELMKMHEDFAAKKRTSALEPKAEKTKSASPVSYLTNFSPLLESKSPAALNGELLESFNELILGLMQSELEILSSLTNENFRRYLIDVVFDKKLKPTEAANYVIALDGNGNFDSRFAIIYCCMHPDKWDDPAISDYKRTVISSYVDRSSGDKDSLDSKKIKEEWLKKHANYIMKKFLIERRITAVKLSEEELAAKTKTLNHISGKELDLLEDANSMEKDKEIIEKLNREEGIPIESISKNISKSSSLFSNTPDMKDGKNLSSELSLMDPRWNKIYDLVKKTQTGLIRPENKMLKVVHAVLYKESTHCSWKGLPQKFLPATTVRHYYNQWKSSKISNQIMQIMTSPVSTPSLVQTKT